MAPSASWPTSHALTLTVMSRLTASTRAAPVGGKQPQQRAAQLVRLDQQVEGEDQDREQAEQAADHAGDRAEHGGHRVPALAHRRPRHRLLHRQRLGQQPLLDQERLRPVEHVGQRAPQLPGLMHDRRHDQEADADQHADDEEVQDEDRQPAREALRADRQRPLALDQTDDRAEADRQQPAHVDEEQDVADEEAGPDDRDGERRHPDRPEVSDFFSVSESDTLAGPAVQLSVGRRRDRQDSAPRGTPR